MVNEVKLIGMRYVIHLQLWINYSKVVVFVPKPVDVNVSDLHSLLQLFKSKPKNCLTIQWQHGKSWGDYKIKPVTNNNDNDNNDPLFFGSVTLCKSLVFCEFVFIVCWIYYSTSLPIPVLLHSTATTLLTTILKLKHNFSQD